MEDFAALYYIFSKLTINDKNKFEYVPKLKLNEKKIYYDYKNDCIIILNGIEVHFNKYEVDCGCCVSSCGFYFLYFI